MWELFNEGFEIEDGVLERYNEVVFEVCEDELREYENDWEIPDPMGCCRAWDKHYGYFWRVAEVEIPKGVTKIGDGAFMDCDWLTLVNIPKSVTEIGTRAFEGCSSLTSITIPESVTEIGDCAFKDCTKLASVTIPESVTKIGNSTFEGCKRLTSITISRGVTAIGDRALEGYRGLIDVTIPPSVTEIGNSAFEGCTSLESIIIPEGVTKIGEKAFSGCTKLAMGAIPKSVTTIGRDAFYGCETLDMIHNKDYSFKMHYAKKYFILWAHYRVMPEEPELLAYIKKNFSRMFPFAIGHDDVETVKFVCEQGTLLTTRNIGKMIEVAFEHEKESENRKLKDNSTEIVNTLIEYCATIVEKASLAQLHRLFDLANEHDLTELKMRVMHIKHKRFPKDEQQENDFSLD